MLDSVPPKDVESLLDFEVRPLPDDIQSAVVAMDRKVLLECASAYLRIADGNLKRSRECVMNLIFEIKFLKDLWNGGDPAKLNELIARKKMLSEWQKTNESAQALLDRAAELYGLPKGYFYSLVEEPSHGVGAPKPNGERGDLTLRNYPQEPITQYPIKGRVPRFIGESVEFYNKRLPPSARMTASTGRNEAFFLKLYGKRGGHQERQLDTSRFKAAATVYIGRYIPIAHTESFKSGAETPFKEKKTSELRKSFQIIKAFEFSNESHLVAPPRFSDAPTRDQGFDLRNVFCYLKAFKLSGAVWEMGAISEAHAVAELSQFLELVKAFALSKVYAFDEGHKRLAPLLRQCGIDMDAKRIRSNIRAREEAMGTIPFLGTAECLERLELGSAEFSEDEAQLLVDVDESAKVDAYERQLRMIAGRLQQLRWNWWLMMQLETKDRRLTRTLEGFGVHRLAPPP